MKGIFQDVRFAARLFRQRPGFTATAVLTLALGIGANIAIFSVLNGVLIRWLPFPNVDRIVKVSETLGEYRAQPFNPANFLDVQRDTTDVFQALAAFRSLPTATLTGFGEATKVIVTATSPQLFDVMGVAPAMGRPLTIGDVESGARSIVVTDSFWRAKLGGESDAIGRGVELDGQTWTIVGVMPRGVAFPNDVELWKPLIFTPQELAARNSWFLQAVGRLRPNTSLVQANASLTRAMAAVARAHPGPQARSAEATDLRESTVSFVRRDLLFAQGVAALILLIAGVNLANLLLANAIARQHEFSIRVSIGAGRGRLVRQLLAESFVLSAIGGTLGTGIAYVLVPALVAAYPGSLPGRDRITVSVAELLVAVGGAVLTTILFGLAPAILGSRVEPAAGLRATPRVGPSRVTHLLRNALVAAEVVITLSLLAGAALLIKSFATLTAQPVGFDASNVLTANVSLPTPRFPTDEQRRGFFSDLIERVSHEPDVVGVATTLPLPFDGHGIGSMFLWDPANGSPKRLVGDIQYVSPGYLDVLKIRLVDGRFFAADDTSTNPLVAVVNEEFSRVHGVSRDVIGMRFQRGAGAPWITIIGVIANARATFFRQPQPQVIFPLAQSGPGSMTLAVRTRTSPARFVPRLREIVRAADPALPLTSVEALAFIIGDSVAQRRFNMSLLVALASLAVLLSVVGVSGVMTYVVGQRTRELGIRLALGARPSQVQVLVVRQGLMPIIAGIAGGVGGAWFLTTLLKKELFRVTPHDPWPLALASIGLLVVGALACWIPSRRTARIDPIKILKVE